LFNRRRNINKEFDRLLNTTSHVVRLATVVHVCR